MTDLVRCGFRPLSCQTRRVGVDLPRDHLVQLVRQGDENGTAHVSDPSVLRDQATIKPNKTPQFEGLTLARGGWQLDEGQREGLSDEVVGFRVAVPVVALTCGGVVGGSPERARGDESNVALKLGPGGGGGLGVHERQGAGVHLLRPSLPGFRDGEREVWPSEIAAEIVNEGDKILLVIGAVLVVHAVVPALVPGDAGEFHSAAGRVGDEVTNVGEGGAREAESLTVVAAEEFGVGGESGILLFAKGIREGAAGGRPEVDGQALSRPRQP